MATNHFYSNRKLAAGSRASKAEMQLLGKDRYLIPQNVFLVWISKSGALPQTYIAGPRAASHWALPQISSIVSSATRRAVIMRYRQVSPRSRTERCEKTCSWQSSGRASNGKKHSSEVLSFDFTADSSLPVLSLEMPDVEGPGMTSSASTETKKQRRLRML